jgi:hypothetical protein
MPSQRNAKRKQGKAKQSKKHMFLAWLKLRLRAERAAPSIEKNRWVI